MSSNDAGAAGGQGPIKPARIVAVQGSVSHEADTDPMPQKPVSTDPGVAPPAGVAEGPALGATAPLGVRVPAPQHANDSVDELLDGMNDSVVPPRKITPESAGKAAASYHAQHQLHPAQETPAPEPKVIVQKRELSITQKIDRSKIPSVAPPELVAEAPPAPVPAARQDPTIDVPRAQGPRLVVALFAGMLVVFALFVAMRLWANRVKAAAMVTDPTASAYILPPPGAAPVETTARNESQQSTQTAAPEPPPPPSATTAAATPPKPTETQPAVAVQPPHPAITTTAPPPATQPPRPPPPVTATTTAAPPPPLDPYGPAPPPKNDVKRSL